jgi:lipoprotein-releasing system ATP-binding protein
MLKWWYRMIQTTSAAVPQDSRPVRDPELRAPIIQVHNLEKTYHTVHGTLTLFHGLDLDVRSGELVAIMGQSGAGKSTLLHILGALDAPTQGTVHCASTNVATLSQREAAAFRNREIGYVWQFHYLLPEFSALENVAMPLLARGQTRRDALATASNWLREVDLEDRSEHRPGELSGGEQQRVALARALVASPRLLLADEPTGTIALVARAHLDCGDPQPRSRRALYADSAPGARAPCTLGAIFPIRNYHRNPLTKKHHFG